MDWLSSWLVLDLEFHEARTVGLYGLGSSISNSKYGISFKYPSYTTVEFDDQYHNLAITSASHWVIHFDLPQSPAFDKTRLDNALSTTEQGQIVDHRQIGGEQALHLHLPDTVQSSATDWYYIMKGDELFAINIIQLDGPIFDNQTFDPILNSIEFK